ncbi:MAG: 1,6-anhydro-N-acetylmuramyl-L-alanine amidase AmpD [Burkholderiaceae bacterium]|nr:1,6-anhydro-N-acetylmuramyl-L-alanine amidase AmpD [Burkholderiaceae bacterium]
MSAPLRVAADGWVEGVARLGSPHFDQRPPGAAVDLLVIHNISLPPGEFGGGHVQRLFTGTLPAGQHPFLDQLAGVRVSAHFLIARDGQITQFVSCADRAWHAGASALRGRSRCNDFSIGVELEGTDFTPFADVQYEALTRLVPALTAALPLAHACGHSEIATDRKTDPGPFFDWGRVPALRRLHDRRA